MNDFVVGCFQGYLHYLHQLSKGKFAKEVYLKDDTDNFIHFGQFWDRENSKWAEENIQRGVSPAIGLYPKLVDIDGDGDLDLVVGNRKGTIGQRLNVGSAKQPKFSATTTFLHADGKRIDSKGQISLDIVDLNKDGKLDLVTVSPQQGIIVYLNEGEKNQFKLTKHLNIEDKKASDLKYPNITCVDENGDGSLDIIVTSNGNDGRGSVKNLIFYQQANKK